MSSNGTNVYYLTNVFLGITDTTGRKDESPEGKNGLPGVSPNPRSWYL